MRNLIIENALELIRIAKSGSTVNHWAIAKATEILTNVYKTDSAKKEEENPEQYGRHQLFAFVQNNQFNLNTIHELPEAEKNILNELLMLQEINENDVNRLFVDAKKIIQDNQISAPLSE